MRALFAANSALRAKISSFNCSCFEDTLKADETDDLCLASFLDIGGGRAEALADFGADVLGNGAEGDLDVEAVGLAGSKRVRTTVASSSTLDLCRHDQYLALHPTCIDRTFRGTSPTDAISYVTTR